MDESEARQRQYEVYVRSTEAMIDRRAHASQYFLTLHTAIFAGIGYILTQTLQGVPAFDGAAAALLALPLAGAFLGWTWLSILSAQARILGDKYRQIEVMEKEMPFSPFTDESAQGQRAGGKRGFAKFERRIPRIFVYAYMGFFVLQLVFVLGLDDHIVAALEAVGSWLNQMVQP